MSKHTLTTDTRYLTPAQRAALASVCKRAARPLFRPLFRRLTLMEKQGVVKGEGEAPADKRADDRTIKHSGDDTASKLADAAAKPPAPKPADKKS